MKEVVEEVVGVKEEEEAEEVVVDLKNLGEVMKEGEVEEALAVSELNGGWIENTEKKGSTLGAAEAVAADLLKLAVLVEVEAETKTVVEVVEVDTGTVVVAVGVELLTGRNGVTMIHILQGEYSNWTEFDYNLGDTKKKELKAETPQHR